MARLNEPPAPAPAPGESVESLKRRFIRQNREIARTNSAQSLRIRTLEAETSRLLSENITLREENIQLKHELDKGQSKYALEQVSGVRGKLEDKLAELSTLVAELKTSETSRPPPSPKTVSRRARKSASSSSSLKRSPNLRGIRNPFEFTEADAAEGRLPPIEEGKSFPRKTLDTEELGLMFSHPNGAVDSPELGPPPVAHFDEGDPIKQNLDTSTSPVPSPSRAMADDTENAESTANLFANLETRRKRRDSSSKKGLDSREGSECKELESLPEPVPEPTKFDPTKKTLKTGAKRKFAVRDEDETAREPRVQNKENDFAFNRRSNNVVHITNSKKDTSGRKHVQEDVKAVSKAERPRATTPSLNRRALGEKPVNTDPTTSPVKSRVASGEKASADKDKNKQIASKAPSGRNSSKEKLPSLKSVPLPKIPSEPKVATIELGDLPPITPAPSGLDLFSPESSAPPTAGNESRDTPPPTDIGGRPSRRRGTGVSYAEPNLRDKMRRPGKELVDAVSDVKLGRSAGQKSDMGLMDGENTAGSISIKHEEDAAPPTWKSMVERDQPTSPLGSKSESTESHVLQPTLDIRRRRVSGAYSNGSDMVGSTSATIAALVAGSNKRLSRARELSAEKQESTEPPRTEGSSIFDFRPSSPENSSAEKQLKVNKRYSSVPDLGKVSHTTGGEVERKKATASSRLQRRRETMAMDEPNTETETPTHADIEEDVSKGSMRAVRAGRRRSMMV